MKLSQTARLEVDQAGHPVATTVAGRIVTTHLVVGRAVQAGEVLAELDAEAPRLQYEEARVQLTALTAQRQARQPGDPRRAGGPAGRTAGRPRRPGRGARPAP